MLLPESLDLPLALTSAQLVMPALPPPPAKPLDFATANDLVAAPAALGDEPLATALDIVFREPAPLEHGAASMTPGRRRRFRLGLRVAPGAGCHPPRRR